MNSSTLELDCIHNGIPPFLKIIANDKIIFEGLVSKYLKLDFDYPDIDRFVIKIKKTGKSKLLLDKLLKQEITIKSLKLNDCDVHPDKFGIFYQSNNAYLKDQTINNTDKLFLNGLWAIDIPIFNFKTNESMLYLDNLRDSVTDSDIACFGCSFTYGALLKKYQTWPYFLSQNLSNKIVKNYGRAGNSIQEIMSTALDYAKNYNVDNIICLLPLPSRMQLIDPYTQEIVTLLPTMSTAIEKKFPDLIKNIVLYGESSLLFAGYVNYFKDTIFKINSFGTKIYISSYNFEFYNFLKSLHIDKITFLPFYEIDKKHPLAEDQAHPGEIHNRLFAESIVKYVN
jgi:hypothetical protein